MGIIILVFSIFLLTSSSRQFVWLKLIPTFLQILHNRLQCKTSASFYRGYLDEKTWLRPLLWGNLWLYRFITTFGFEESDRSQNEEDEFLAYRPNGLLICYAKKSLPLLWLSCNIDMWCSDSVGSVSKYQSMYHLEKKELPSWIAILRGWTDLKVKLLEETFESLSQSVKDCLLMSETFLKLHPKRLPCLPGRFSKILCQIF